MQGIRIGIRFDKVCKDFENLVSIALSARPRNQKIFEALIEIVLIRLHDEWGKKCRSIVINSALGYFRTRSGCILPRSPAVKYNTTPLKTLRLLWTTKKKMDRFWEPKWYAPQPATRAARLLKVANESTILSAFGASTTPDDLRVVRNVIVHSSANCWQKYQQLAKGLGFSFDVSPVELACSLNLSKGERYIETWMNNLRNNIWAALK